jgi:hypothetical protein
MSLSLPITLQVSADKFLEMYNLDIEPFVERHSFKEKAQSKGGASSNVIRYMSYSHAIRLLKSNFPGWKVEWIPNELAGGALYKEIDDRAYFIKVYVHNGHERSEILYYPLLTISGTAIPVIEKYEKDKPVYSSQINSQNINKAIMRAISKIIAITTGIGLKLWTGDDLADEIIDAITAKKQKFVEGISKLLAAYRDKFNSDLLLPDDEGNLKSVVFTINMTEYELKELGKRVKQELDKEVPALISHAELLLNQEK